MVYSGIIAILIAIWIYRTAVEAKTGNTLYWVAGSVIAFMLAKTMMIYFNAMIIEIFDGDVSVEYDEAGGLNRRDNSDTAGLQTGTGGSLIGIMFELSPAIIPFFVVAVLRLMVMLKQPFGFMPLFGGIKETFVAIGDSFKESDKAAAEAAADSEADEADSKETQDKKE